jgi:hypothetical protein
MKLKGMKNILLPNTVPPHYHQTQEGTLDRYCDRPTHEKLFRFG